jgi:hypothetical protein
MFVVVAQLHAQHSSELLINIAQLQNITTELLLVHLDSCAEQTASAPCSSAATFSITLLLQNNQTPLLLALHSSRTKQPVLCTTQQPPHHAGYAGACLEAPTDCPAAAAAAVCTAAAHADHAI